MKNLPGTVPADDSTEYVKDMGTPERFGHVKNKRKIPPIKKIFSEIILAATLQT